MGVKPKNKESVQKLKIYHFKETVVQNKSGNKAL